MIHSKPPVAVAADTVSVTIRGVRNDGIRDASTQRRAGQPLRPAPLQVHGRRPE